MYRVSPCHSGIEFGRVDFHVDRLPTSRQIYFFLIYLFYYCIRNCSFVV